MRPERCAVTGAAGFVGRRLVEALSSGGTEVVALDRGDPPGPFPGVRPVRADICDRGALADAFAGAESVFHLAALLPQRHASPEDMRRVNVEGTVAVVEEAQRAGVARLVHLSSSEVYGVPSVLPCPEDGPLAPIGEYGRNKVAAETVARDAGLPAVVLRPPTIVGPGMREPLFEILFRNAARGLPLVLAGGGRNRLQMVSVDDVVEACVLAATVEEAAGEVVNIGYDPVLTLAETAWELKALLGLRSRIVSVPRLLAVPLVRLAARLPRFPLEADHAPLALEDYYLDTSRARRILGWEPRKSPVVALAEAYDHSRGGR